LIDDKTEKEKLNQAMTQEELKKVKQENEKKRISKAQIAWKVASGIGKKVQEM
jgi:hypothetical protein